MGWLWTSPPPPPTDPKPPPPPANVPKGNLENINDTDSAIEQFFDFTPGRPAKPSTSNQASSSPNSDVISSSGPLHPVAEAILPSRMSCRQAFDYAFSCNRAPSQFNAVYRYGSVRECSHLWDNFWFCMRTRTASPELKANMIRHRFREIEREKYGPGKPSSEDIWQSRDEMVEPGSVFDHPIPDPAAIGDEEWHRMETERRRLIRQNLGFED
ncbi:hypothetical protein CDD81_6505 [Ophiocordyceps australis]|uniref:Early meiotic induction protein 1 n=1 Tax=Ophiocordyceps australis TaxID=1399860 RepID=A0A2C5XLW6_9HYPO|nr:hypothetical protein CDD81_6505 [Ophiocordyceps australis]